jgi:hypothetical protein
MREIQKGLAVDAVTSEPLSRPNSLLTGKNTGKFVNLAPNARQKRTYTTESVGVIATQPRFLSRGEQGINIRISGNSHSLISPFWMSNEDLISSTGHGPMPTLLLKLFRRGLPDRPSGRKLTFRAVEKTDLAPAKRIP